VDDRDQRMLSQKQVLVSLANYVLGFMCSSTSSASMVQVFLKE